jgi:hypothetical protein
LFAEADESADDLSDEERLDTLTDTAEHPVLSHSEVNDQDWMELVWTLRYQQPEIFREVLLILRARASAEAHPALAVEPASAAGQPPAGLEEESAL